MPRIPDLLTGYQLLAWIAWRDERVFDIFDGSGEQQRTLWEQARAGKPPGGLPHPKITPLAAERELREAMTSGALPFRIVPDT